MAVHLRAGTRLKGYTLTSDTVASDAGTSIWAFAERDGFEYFIKCYLTPTHPADDAPGSAESKERKRAGCRAFERRMAAIESALTRCEDSHFIVRAVDFFRYGGSYFKVTKKIRSQPLGVAQLSADKQLLIALSAVYAVRMVHRHSTLIHADLKQENFILQRRGARFVANLIDFDASFFEGAPPDRDGFVGDQRYWSPELIRFLSDGRGAESLSQKLDVFSLGIILCEFLTGRLPRFPRDYDSVGEALVDGAPLRVPPVIHPELSPAAQTIEAMVRADPARRPSLDRVHDDLRALNKKLFVHDDTFSKIAASLKQGLKPGANAALEKTGVSPGWRSGLKITGLKIKGNAFRERLAVSYKARKRS